MENDATFSSAKFTDRQSKLRNVKRVYQKISSCYENCVIKDWIVLTTFKDYKFG